MGNHSIEKVNPCVSVVIPCFNYGHFLIDAINSALNSTFEDIEIIVVDDGSTDPLTVQILDNLNTPRTRAIRQPNKKLPGARNTGFREARGKYILPLDADDLIHPTLIEKAVWVLENRHDVGFVSFWLELFGNENLTWAPIPFNFHTLLHANHVTVTSLVRKSAWEQVGGYNEHMTLGYEDWDFWIKLGGAGWLGHQIAEPLFFYRKHGASMITAAQKRHDQIVAQIRRNHRQLFSRRSMHRTKLVWQDGLHPDEVRKLPLIRAKRLARRTLKHLVPETGRPAMLSKLRALRQLARDARQWLKRTHRAPGDGNAAIPSRQGMARLKPSRPPSPRLSFLEHGVQPRRGHAPHMTLLVPDLEPGDAARVRLDLVRFLKKSGREVTVVALGGRGEGTWRALQSMTTDVFCLPQYGLERRQFAATIARIIESRGSDLIIVADTSEGADLVPAIAARFPGLPIIGWTLGNRLDQDESPLECLARQAENLRLIVTGSSREADTLIRTFNVDADKTRIVPIGVPGDEAWSGRNRPAEASLHIGYVGDLTRDDGVLRFLRIAARLSDADPDSRYRFHIEGQGSLKNTVIAFISEHGLEDRLMIYEPAVAGPGILSRLDLLVAPVKRALAARTVLAAFANGTPVLASRSAGWPDEFKTHETLALEDIYDETAFVRRAEQLLTSPATARHIRENAYRYYLERHTEKLFEQSVAEVIAGLDSKVAPSTCHDLSWRISSAHHPSGIERQP